MEPGSPCLGWDPRAVQHPPKRWGSAARTPPRRGRPTGDRRVDLLLVDLTSQPSPADISLHSSHGSQSRLHALDLILCDRPAEDLPSARRPVRCCHHGPGVCNEEPFDPDAIDAWRSKSRQLLEDPALRHPMRKHGPHGWRKPRPDDCPTSAGGLPLLQPKMN